MDVDSINGLIDGNGLLCLTNNTACCSGFQNLNGDWYYPNGIRVGSFSERNINTSVTFFFETEVKVSCVLIAVAFRQREGSSIVN